MHALQLQMLDQRVQMLGIAFDGVVEVLGFVGCAEAGHVRGDGGHEFAGSADQRMPVCGGTGIAVDEHHAFGTHAGFKTGGGHPPQGYQRAANLAHAAS